MPRIFDIRDPFFYSISGVENTREVFEIGGKVVHGRNTVSADDFRKKYKIMMMSSKIHIYSQWCYK